MEDDWKELTASELSPWPPQRPPRFYNLLRGSDFSYHEGVRNDHKVELFFDYCFDLMWFGKIRSDFYEWLLLLWSNNYTVWTLVDAATTDVCVCECLLVMSVYQWIYLLSLTLWDQQVLLCLEGLSFGLGQNMFCLLRVYFTSVICLLLIKEECLVTAKDILPTQPNPSGVHHYTQMLLIHILILFHTCKLKWNEELNSSCDWNYPS